MNAIFLTARTKSSRLPSKCLLDVAPDLPTVKFLIQRLQGMGYPLILCTSDSEADNILAALGKSCSIKVFRGSEEDKVKRWLDCAERYKVDFFVSADGDDLFVEPDFIKLAFKQYEEKGHKFIQCSGTPTGTFSWGMEVKALQELYTQHVPTSKNTEMAFSWFVDNHELEGVPEKYYRHDIRMTLDYQEDLDFFRAVYAKIGNKYLDDIISFLEVNPDIAKINISREYDWKSNQQKQIGQM